MAKVLQFGWLKLSIILSTRCYYKNLLKYKRECSRETLSQGTLQSVADTDSYSACDRNINRNFNFFSLSHSDGTPLSIILSSNIHDTRNTLHSSDIHYWGGGQKYYSQNGKTCQTLIIRHQQMSYRFRFLLFLTLCQSHRFAKDMYLHPNQAALRRQ